MGSVIGRNGGAETGPKLCKVAKLAWMTDAVVPGNIRQQGRLHLADHCDGFGHAVRVKPEIGDSRKC